MEFDGDIGLIQRKVANVPEGEARRNAVFDALAPKPGQVILDIGCGGGHLTKMAGLAVGDKGRSIGLDISEDQISNARQFCEGVSSVELAVGDATDLDLPDRTFDGVSSIQTLEYIDNIDQALLEIKRVTKSGGRIAFVSVLWDLWRFHGPDAELNEFMLEVWKKHCPHQMLPMEIGRKLENVGFRDINQSPIAFINMKLGENTYAYWASQLVTVFALANDVPKEKVDSWLAQLSESDTEGRFGFASIPVLTTAIAV